MAATETPHSPARQIPQAVHDNAQARRVVLSPVPAPVTAPVTAPTLVHGAIDSVADHSHELFIQCLYMVPVVGNAMSLWDVGTDVYRLCSQPSAAKNLFEWGILVIDAIGVVPAAGNASRPARAVVKEVLLAFAKGQRTAVLVDLFWATAGGDVIEFMAHLDEHLKRWQADIIKGVQQATRTIRTFVQNPISAAEQIGVIRTNKGFWSWVSSTEEVALYGIDELLKLSGQRTAILAWLDEFERNTEPMIRAALGDAAKAGTLLFMAAQIVAEIKARRGRGKTPSHTAQAAPGELTEPHRKPGEHRDTTQKPAKPSKTPARDGCGCPITASPKPVNYAMGDENLAQTDFVLDGIVPIVWTRRYRSSLCAYDNSPLGARWSSPYHLSLAPQDDGSFLFFDPDNRPVPLPAVEVGESVEVPGEQLTLHRPDGRQVRLTYPDGASEAYTLHGTRYRLTTRSRRDGMALMLSYDNHGNLIGMTGGAEATIRLDYVEGRVSAIHRVDLNGDIQQTLARYRYDRAGDLVRHENVLGHTRSFAYVQHLLTQYTDFNGNAHHLEWAWPGRAHGLPAPADATCVRTWIGKHADDPREDTRFEYHREHWYTKVTDADGGITYQRYDYHNRIVMVEHPDGSSERFEWDDHNNVVGVTNAEGQVQRFAYDEQGRATAVTDALGNTTRTEYDAAGLPVKVTAPTGEVTQTAYDELGHPVSVTDPAGRMTQYAWSGAGLLLALTDPKGGVQTFTYDHGGRLTCVQDCSGHETRYSYDANGFLLQRIDAEGHSTGYRHDASGQLLTRTHPDKREERFTYDREGNLTAYTDAAGQVTEYSYNARHQPTLRRDAAGRELWYFYDKQWRLARLQNEAGEATRFTYDVVGQLVKQTGFDDRTVQYAYDAAGRLIGTVEGEMRTDYERDPLGRLTRRSVRAEGLRSSVDEHFHYDAQGRLVTAGSGVSTVQLHYDDAGNLVAELQRHGSAGSGYVTVSRHEYDALGHRTRTTLPNTRTVDWLRYGSGHLHGVQLDGQALLDVERDGLHREVARQHRGWRQTRAYDVNGRLDRIAVHERKGEGDADVPGAWIAQRQYLYSQTGHLARIQDHARGVTDYTYDPVGRLLKAASPDLTEVFAFDPAGNPVDPDKIAPRPEVESKPDKVLRHAREAAEDAAWLREHPGEKYAPLRWDERTSRDREKLKAWEASLPRCVGNVLRELSRTRYAHDAYGNLVRRTEPNGVTWLYQYDAANRLERADRYATPPPAEALKRIERTADGVLHAFPARVEPDMQVRFLYDAFGRRTLKAVERAGRLERTFFTWDGDVLLMEERFLQAKPQAFTPHEYQPIPIIREHPEDAYSVPVAQRQHTLAQSHQWQGASLYLHEPDSFVPLARLDETLVEPAFMATGTDGRYVQVPAKSRHATLFYLNDHLGTPQEMVDESGKVVWLARYKAWGGLKTTHKSADPAETTNAIRFQGQYHDVETGLHYNRHRYYDPGSGRFISKDPVGLAGGINVYAYAPNPTGWVDPFGFSKIPATAGRKQTSQKPNQNSKCPCRKEWEVNRFDRVCEATLNGTRVKYFRDPNTELWWSQDTEWHGGSAWKVMAQAGNNFVHRQDADIYGDYMNKHKGNTGKTMPMGDMKCRNAEGNEQ
ncbi:RHS repeat-associated core domain-containing protein [Cupriavidus metallidurans]|uniref:RHS repeat-associated core domain-containing protein n=1 Tax=Cupriavidus metallidurans TaxID=119219 RepID=UPI001CB9A181|nr:RHS repeat-associated core domain-containing protein [Cupriavidus metallidurans]